MPSTRLTLAFILTTLLIIIGIINCLYQTQASHSPFRALPDSYKAQTLGGRWQLVQASLGIELFPDSLPPPLDITVPYPLSRISFRRNKRTQFESLHFAHDALRVQKISLKELVVSLRRIAHEETKGEALRSDSRRSRARLGRGIGIHKRQTSTPH